jgi:hypothetical protein
LFSIGFPFLLAFHFGYKYRREQENRQGFCGGIVAEYFYSVLPFEFRLREAPDKFIKSASGGFMVS